MLNRFAREDDLGAIGRIYAHYVEHTYATFDLETPSLATWRARWETAQHKRQPWLVAEDGDRLVGYATLSSHRQKPAYDTTVESTVYLDPAVAGRGLGRELYAAALREAAGHFHVAVAGIALPNPASVAIHEALGFTAVGVFEEVGRKFGVWRDVGWWQLRLETL